MWCMKKTVSSPLVELHSLWIQLYNVFCGVTCGGGLNHQPYVLPTPDYHTWLFCMITNWTLRNVAVEASQQRTAKGTHVLTKTNGWMNVQKLYTDFILAFLDFYSCFVWLLAATVNYLSLVVND